MSVPSAIGQVLSDHVTLEVECIDRLYLNVFQAELQIERAVYHLLRQQRGQGAVSSRCFVAMTHRFVRDIAAFAQQHGLTIRVFQKGQRKEGVAAACRAGFTGEGIYLIGKAQEKVGTQRASALPFGGPVAMALWHVLLLMRLIPDGLRSRDLNQPPAQLPGQDPAAWTQGRRNYQLRRLRLEGLIERQNGAHRYQVTPHSLSLAMCLTRCYARLLRPDLTAALQQLQSRPENLTRVQHVSVSKGYNVQHEATRELRAMRRRPGTLLFVVLLLGGGWYGYSKIWAAPPPPQYRTAEVGRGNIVATVTATGTIQPLVTVLVGSQVSGTILRWNADFNQQVKKGEVLAEIDPDRFRRELDMRTAAVAVARANLEQARVRLADGTRERKRIEGLFQKGTASENELLIVQAAEAERQAAVQAAEAQVQVAEAERQASQVDLDRTIISSPIDGVVISRDIDAGQTVAASLQAPTLFTIAADLRAMQVHANLSETDVGQIHAGMQAEFTVDAYPGRKFRGTVSQVRFNPTIVDNVVSYITIIDVDNEDLALRPGMTATVAFEVARVDDVLTVPNAALRFRPRSPDGESSGPPRGTGFGPPGRMRRGGAAATPTVYQLVNGQPVEMQITVGLTDGARSEISGEGVAEGLKVIVEQIATGPPRPFNPAGAMAAPR